MNRQFFNTYKTALILLAASVLLLLVLAAESTFHERHRERFEQALQHEHRVGALFSELPADEITLGPLDNYADIVNHPLFLEGRMPVENAGEPAQKPSGDGNAGPGDSSLSLSGVVMMPGSILALLTDKSGKHFRVKQGESIQGWVVESVSSDKIVMTSGSQRKELLLREFKPAKPTPPQPGAKVPAPVPQGVPPPVKPPEVNPQPPVPAPAPAAAEPGPDNGEQDNSESENADPDAEDQ